MNLKDKIAFITGSSRGIGFTIAKALHEKGCKVLLNGRNSTELDHAVSVLTGSHGFVGDMSNPTDAHNCISEINNHYGALDILVCNVGASKSTPPGSETFSEWQRMFLNNFFSTTNIIEAARDNLKKTKGVIVCISSICGIEVIQDAPITYSVAKSALNFYIKGISRPLGKDGIRINGIAPGNILFPGSVWENKILENSADVQLMLTKEISLSKLGTTDDIANLVVYLSSPLSTFVTGSIWTIDGGQVRS